MSNAITDEEYNLLEEDVVKYMKSTNHQSCSWGEVKRAYMAGAQDQLSASKEQRDYCRTIVKDNKKLREEVSQLEDKIEQESISFAEFLFKNYRVNSFRDEWIWEPLKRKYDIVSQLLTTKQLFQLYKTQQTKTS